MKTFWSTIVKRIPVVGYKHSTVLKNRKRLYNRPLTEVQIRSLLNAIDNIRDDALIRLGLSTGLKVSELVNILITSIDLQRGCITVQEENKERTRIVMPTMNTVSAIRKYLNSLEGEPEHLFPLSTRTVERVIQKHSKRALGFAISWHSIRATYVSRSIELGQSPAVVMANTGDGPATIFKYYGKLPKVAMRRFVESKPVIPQGTT